MITRFYYCASVIVPLLVCYCCLWVLVGDLSRVHVHAQLPAGSIGHWVPVPVEGVREEGNCADPQKENNNKSTNDDDGSTEGMILPSSKHVSFCQRASSSCHQLLTLPFLPPFAMDDDIVNRNVPTVMDNSMTAAGVAGGMQSIQQLLFPVVEKYLQKINPKNVSLQSQKRKTVSSHQTDRREENEEKKRSDRRQKIMQKYFSTSLFSVSSLLNLEEVICPVHFKSQQGEGALSNISHTPAFMKDQTKNLGGIFEKENVPPLRSQVGRVTMRSRTNITDFSFRSVVLLVFGEDANTKRHMLHFKGQRVWKKPPEGGMGELGIGKNKKGEEGKKTSDERNIPTSSSSMAGLEEVYIGFGSALDAPERHPLTEPFLSADRSPKRKWINASTAIFDFLDAVRMARSYNGSTNALQIDQLFRLMFYQGGRFVRKLTTSENTFFSSGDSKSSPASVGPRSRSLSTCHWLGFFIKRWEGDSSSVLVIEGALISTCNMSVYFRITPEEFEHVAEKTLTFAILMFIASLFAGFGSVRLRNKITHSRGSSLKVSLLTMMWVCVVDFVLAVLMLSITLSVSHGGMKGLVSSAFGWFILFSLFDASLCTTVYNAVAQAGGTQGICTTFLLQRGRVFYYLLLLAVIFICAELGLVLLSAPSLLLVSSFFIPQIVHNVQEDVGNGLESDYIFGVALSKLIPVWYFHFTSVHTNFLSFASDASVGIVVTLWVTAQCAVLYWQKKRGARVVIPSFLRPKKYSYVASEPQHVLAVQEDPDCPICKVSLLHPTAATQALLPSENEESGMQQHQDEPHTHSIPGEGETGLALWVTPCGHFFHAQCLLQWMEQQGDCPICRSRLPKP